MQSIFSSSLFQGRSALITGGGTGIGFAIAQELGRLGAAVVLASRSEATLAAAANTLTSAGISAQWRQVNVRCDDQVAQLFDEFSDAGQDIDILVNNAGGQFAARAIDISPNGFRAVVDLNLTGTWLMSRAFARYLITRRLSGRIINIVLSIDGGAPGYVHAAAARAGVTKMTKTLALEWAQYGINVNAVAPGIIDTSGLLNYEPSQLTEAIAALPITRMGNASEVATCVAFLASSGGGYITGETLFVDGGKHLSGKVGLSSGGM